MIYGETRMQRGIDGVELLKEGADIAAHRILTDEDLKRIRIQRLKQAARKVDKHGFASSSEEEDSDKDGEEVNPDEVPADADPERKKAIKKALKQYEYMHASSQEDGSDSDLEGMEEGEMEMEEGEYEWEEGEVSMEEEGGESEQESDSQEQPPRLVPIAAKAAGKKKEEPKVAEPLKFIKGKKGKIEAPSAAVQADDDANSVKVGKKRTRVQAEIESDVSDSSSDDDSSEESSLDSDMDTEELEQLEAEQEGEQSNVHGFVYSADLNTYRMNKQERKDAAAIEKENGEKKEYLSHAAKRRAKKNSGNTNIEKLKNKPMNMLLPKRIVNRNEKRDGKLKTKKKSDLKQLGHFTKNKKQKIDSKKKMRIS